ncbi:MAG TPA: acyltransferase [Rhodopila sp.]|uniref:acyltransferase family protein n=1 Tax=Rhodopila sp. TaxID=2480087 RepID=UPI002CF838F0|nr:acyltransferase [Rhodopila sp.]HVY14996.1 acyltransferase [Rhodopila sp.]
MRAAKPHDLLGVQALRAAAALMVVAYHAVDQWTTHRTGYPPGDLWPNGSAGVDVFFVISGLVMTISVQRNQNRPHPAWSFARDRLIRIVPLYWIVTTLKIAAVVALPALATRTRLDPLYVAGSYALLPVHDWTGTLRPVLPVGWTLTYEMFFYILVTVALCVRMPLERVCAPILAIVAVLGVVGPDNGFANTIVLEFLAGVAIGRLMERLQQMSLTLASALGVCGFGVLVVAPLPNGDLRPLIWGVPAALLVVAVVAAEAALRRVTPRWLLAAGNASYATYLTHGFVVPAVYLVIGHISNNNEAGLAAMIALSLLLSAAGGQITHVVLEQPVLAFLRHRRTAPAAMAPG